jgi:hypothetical protein
MIQDDQAVFPQPAPQKLINPPSRKFPKIIQPNRPNIVQRESPLLLCLFLLFG